MAVFLLFKYLLQVDKNIRILLVEDEKSLSDVIALNLRMKEYQTEVISDGAEALKSVTGSFYDLIILDIMLPNVDGFEICKKIRENDEETKILIISAKDSSADKIKGLKLGADDYLPKPFDLEELMLRVNSLLKRNTYINIKEDTYEFGSNCINFSNFMASNSKSEFQLTKREADLLQLLVEKEGQVVSREEILKRVWGYDVLPNTRTIDNFILAFRKYFEKNPKQPKHFHSVWGVGYRFTSN